MNARPVCAGRAPTRRPAPLPRCRATTLPLPARAASVPRDDVPADWGGEEPPPPPPPPGGGGGKNGNNGDDNATPPSWRGGAGALLVGAAGGAAAVTAARRQGKEAAGSAAVPPPPRSRNPLTRLTALEADTDRLRRLARDAFQAITEVTDRVDAGGGGGPPARTASARKAVAAAAAGHFAPLGALRRRAGAPAHSPAVPPGTTSVEGELVTDGAWWSGGATPALRTRLRACVHGSTRAGAGADAFFAQVDAVQGGSPCPLAAAGVGGSAPPGGGGRGGGATMAALTKALYAAALAPGCRLLLAPLGARGDDVAPTLNPVAGAGLTAAARHGCALHARAAGAAVAASWRGPRAGVVAARFAPGSARPGVAATTLLQVDAALAPGASVGVTALVDAPKRTRTTAALGPWSPSPPPSSASTADASDDESRSSASLTGGAAGGGLAAAATAAVALPRSGALIGAWAAAGAPGDGVGRGGREWGLTLASPPRAGGEGWLLAATGGGSDGAARGVAEASATLRLGAGLTVTPGVVLARGGRAAVVCRSVVAF